MERRDIIFIGTIAGLILISVWLLIGPEIFGEITGTYSGLVAIIAFVVWGWYLYERVTRQSQAKIDELEAYLHRVPPEEDIPHKTTTLAEDQTELVTQIENSHRLFIAQFISASLLAPVVSCWGFLFIFAAAPPLDRFLIEMAMIGVPFALFLILLVKQGQVFLVYFKAMDKYLQTTKKAVNTGRGQVDITTYINLLFIIIHPDRTSLEDEPKEAIDQIRTYTRYLKWMPLLEIVVFVTVLGTFGLMFLSLGIYLVNPLLISSIYWLTVFFIGLMVVRYWIFFRWRGTVRRWLKIYSALVGWSDDLEQAFLGKIPQKEED